MGFGLLLIGYFMINIMAIYAPFAVAMPIGYGIVMFACYRLAPYHSFFLKSLVVSALGVLFGVYYGIYGLASVGLFGQLSFLGGTFYDVVEWCYFAYTLIFHIAILRGLMLLATDLGLLEIQSTAMRNLVFVGIYHLFYLVAKLPVPFISSHATAFALPVSLLRFFCAFLNIWLFFRCYRHILPEGSDMPVVEEDKPKKNKKGN